jgi:hypothetical protein
VTAYWAQQSGRPLLAGTCFRLLLAAVRDRRVDKETSNIDLSFHHGLKASEKVTHGFHCWVIKCEVNFSLLFN